MKKFKMLALALSSAVMIAGAGYAAWTDQLDVTTTVDTGKLNVQFVGPENPGGNNYYASPRMFYLDKNAPGAQPAWNSAVADDLLKSKVTYGAKKMTFTFSNMYPGTRGAGLYVMENNGTIPAVIQKVNVETATLDAGANGAEVLDAMTVTHSWLKIKRGSETVASTYIASIPLAELEGKLNGFFKGKRLQPGDIVVLGESEGGDKVVDTFNFELPYNSLNGDEGELETVKIDVSFDFVQHNMFDTRSEQ